MVRPTRRMHLNSFCEYDATVKRRPFLARFDACELHAPLAPLVCVETSGKLYTLESTQLVKYLQYNTTEGTQHQTTTGPSHPMPSRLEPTDETFFFISNLKKSSSLKILVPRY